MIGVVVIGRNEGQRLVSSISSILRSGYPVVYVDSASTDGSDVEVSRLGVDVVGLPMDKPFTAGRARNFGFQRILEKYPELQFVQFVDGDCDLAPEWIASAKSYLDSDPQLAIVFGRRREKHPDQSVYNAVCDREWDGQEGFTPSSGGDFLCRVSAFAEVNGFDEKLIAGEEPDMCYRLGECGWLIYRVGEDMTYHDAAITSFSQWAKRSRRSGYAYAARCFKHIGDGNGYCVKENLRILFWAAVLPIAILTLAALASLWFSLFMLMYPIQYLRLVNSEKSGLVYPAFLMIGNWTEFSGQVQFAFRLWRGKEQRIIEYK